MMKLVSGHFVYENAVILKWQWKNVKRKKRTFCQNTKIQKDKLINCDDKTSKGYE